jgi:hypothetical protein
MQSKKDLNPGDPIRSVDPIGNDRIRVGFRRNPTSSIKNRSDPIRLLSDSFQSESDPDFVGIHRIPTERNPTTTLSDPIDIIWIRQDPTPHESPGILEIPLLRTAFRT